MKDASNSHERIEKKLAVRMKRYDQESRMLVKRSEDYSVLEEVFDRPTLMVLYDLMNSGVFQYLNGVVGTGKEARIYWGVVGEGVDVAVKIFLVATAEFKKRAPYILGDPRFHSLKKGARNLVELWARKEYRSLVAAHNAGVRVPKPIVVKRNVLVMEFIGEDGRPAPLLGSLEVDGRIYRRVLAMVRRLYRRAGLVHADLSEYNIFKMKRELIFFDFGSAVDKRHPSARAFLERDVYNINRFFARRGVKTDPDEEVLHRVVGHEL